MFASHTSEVELWGFGVLISQRGPIQQGVMASSVESQDEAVTWLLCFLCHYTNWQKWGLFHRLEWLQWEHKRLFLKLMEFCETTQNFHSKELMETAVFVFLFLMRNQWFWTTHLRKRASHLSFYLRVEGYQMSSRRKP